MTRSCYLCLSAVQVFPVSLVFGAFVVRRGEGRGGSVPRWFLVSVVLVSHVCQHPRLWLRWWLGIGGKEWREREYVAYVTKLEEEKIALGILDALFEVLYRWIGTQNVLFATNLCIRLVLCAAVS